MSGAQAKAATISGCIGIVAEVFNFSSFPFILFLYLAILTCLIGQLRGAKETLRSRLGVGNDRRRGSTGGTRQDCPSQQRSINTTKHFSFLKKSKSS